MKRRNGKTLATRLGIITRHETLLTGFVVAAKNPGGWVGNVGIVDWGLGDVLEQQGNVWRGTEEERRGADERQGTEECVVGTVQQGTWDRTRRTRRCTGRPRRCTGAMEKVLVVSASVSA
jgi:hypothetical protein